jgi:hypothetical protein
MGIRFAIGILSIVGLTTAACEPDATAPDAATTSKPSLSATSQTQSSTFEIDLLFFVPCANGGAGEDIELTGSIHDVFHVTQDGHGGFNVKTHDNPQGVVGTGLITGTKYQGTGVTQTHFNLRVGEHETDVNNFRLIGQGPGNNYLVHDNFHVTINANGVVTAAHDNFSVQCK